MANEQPIPKIHQALLKELRRVLAEDTPFCSGTFELPSNAFELYYGRKNARFLDFTESANDVQALRQLADACEPAKFGKGTETVLDETYRKAGKMDPENFKTGLDVDACGLVDTVQTGLLPEKRLRDITAELYKLNVYGEGAFFKPHLDTPRKRSMFGSLVVVMPTPHQGGEVTLRHGEREWRFDAAKLLSGKASNAIAYIAFFSDVEHEVLPVTSGYRVTLTYNLYYTWDTSTRLYRQGVSSVMPAHADVSNLCRILGGLLDDPGFLPEGGNLGFGLRHRYPFPTLYEGWRHEDPLDSLERWLKGSDHSLFQACEESGLHPLLRLIHDHRLYGGSLILLEGMFNLPDNWDGEMDVSRLLLEEEAEALGAAEVKNKKFGEGDVHDFYENMGLDGDDFEAQEKIEIYWVTDWERADHVVSEWLTYGNEASIEYLYAHVCLIAKVPPAQDRIQSSTEDSGSDTEDSSSGEGGCDGEHENHNQIQRTVQE